MHIDTLDHFPLPNIFGAYTWGLRHVVLRLGRWNCVQPKPFRSALPHSFLIRE